MAEYGGKQRNQLSKVTGSSESKDVQLKRFIDNRPQAASQMNLIRSIQKKPNNTGLPDNLKSGVENLSGFSMDDVKVHYNSDKPAQLNALAYAQGTDIHVAPRQEKHLPHEAWHVVQQKQGRVQPTAQMQGVDVNDDKGLEKEVDVMGEKTLSFNKINDRLYGGVKNIQRKERAQFKHAIPHTVVQRLMTSDEFINSTKPKVGRRGVHNGAYYTAIQSRLNRFHDQDANNFANKLQLLNEIEEQVQGWIEMRPNSSRAQARNILLTQVRTKRNEIWQQINEMDQPERENAIMNIYNNKRIAPPSQIPHILLANLTEIINPLAKVRQLFTNLNQFPFVYTGSFTPAAVGYAAGRGDCCTLSLMFKEMIESQGEKAILRHRNEKQLVMQHNIHGRIENFNTDDRGIHCWYFQEHYWVETSNIEFDVLFMVTPPPGVIQLTEDKKYKEVNYQIFNNGYCRIARTDLLAANIQGQGLVFSTELDAQNFIDSLTI